MDGYFIDFEQRREMPTRAAVERLVVWTAPARAALGIEVAIPEANGAQRAKRALAAGASIEEIYRESVAETQRTYVPEGVSTA
jgi:carboxylate-amine ligase